MNIKVISYSDTYVRVPPITQRNWKWRLIKLTLALLLISLLLLYKLKLAILTNWTPLANVPATRLRHLNPCRHVTPEPEVILHEKFASHDYFFPSSYKERKCVDRKNESSDESNLLQTCFAEKYHCVTRYRDLAVVRIPYPGNGTCSDWIFEMEHIPVACECSITKIVIT